MPRSILEVGCGANPYAALRFLCDGVERYVANDTAPVNLMFNRKTIDALIACLNALHPELGARLSGIMTPAYTARNLAVIGETPCENLALAAPVELITSTSVLAMTTRPSAVVSAFHRLLSSDGLMWHSIDLRDRRDPAKPFDFLYRSNSDYDEKTGNRLRSSDWMTTLQDGGFEIVEALYLVQDRNEQQQWTADRSSIAPVLTEEQRKLFAPPFDLYALDDLSTLAVQVACRKL